jgi:parallel beta-helix repeat protein
VRNTSNITIEGIDFEDIDSSNKTYASGCAANPVAFFGNAIYLYSDPQTDPPTYLSIENIVIQNNVFHDFNGDAWIDFLAQDLSPGVGQESEIAISSNNFETDAMLNGGCAATEGQHVYTISIHGSLNYPDSGLVENVSIAENQFETSYIEGAVAIWSDVSRISVQYNTVNGAGNMLPHVTGEPYRYAILVYADAYEAKKYKPPQPGNGLPPDTIWIVGNTITNPETSGIYVLTSTNMDIQSNTISGQTDTDDETLPKGAIVLNGSTTMSSYPLESNTLSDNFVGLAVVLGSNKGLVGTGSNQITVPSNSFGAKLTVGPNTTDTLDFQGITLTATPGTNATSVIGFGNPGSPAFVGMAQTGWTATGGSNPALIWYDTPAKTIKYTSFSQVPNVVFGNVHNPITADGVAQGAFWHP